MRVRSARRPRSFLAAALSAALLAAGLVAATAVPAHAATRLAGADRYSTAVAISNAAFPEGASIAYLATGSNFPDALSAAPAATAEGGPLLLSMPDRLPESVSAELTRLGVSSVVVVGGASAISPGVVDQLQSLGLTVERVAGEDRFATSRALIARAFSGVGAPQMFLATGSNFPDALSAGGAGGGRGIPVLLVDGRTSGPTAADTALFAALGTTSATVIGGTAAIGDVFVWGLSSSIGSVSRLAGGDRYETSVLINQTYPSQSRTAILATGTAYADALAGAVLAGRTGQSLYVVTPACLPPVIGDALSAASINDLTLLGGTAALSGAVESRTVCLPPPPPPAPPVPTPPIGSPGNPHTSGVTPGAFCAGALSGHYGRTVTGLLMVCTTSATDSRLRWRRA